MLENAAPANIPDAALLEPLTQQFVDAIADGPKMRELSPKGARRFLADIQSSIVGKPAVRFEDLVVPTGPTGAVPIRIVRPERASETLPALVYVHGGRTFGDKETHDRLIREIAVGAHVALFFVDYDRSPEARYPVAIEQVYAVTKYVVEHA